MFRRLAILFLPLLLSACSDEAPKNGVVPADPSGGLVLDAKTTVLLDATGAISVGPVAVGSSAEIVATLANTSEQRISEIAASFTGTAFRFTGGAFPGTGGDCPDPLPSGTTCTVSVTFTPPPDATSSGQVDASLHVSFLQGTRDRASLFEDYAVSERTVDFPIVGLYVFTPVPAALVASTGSPLSFGNHAPGTTTDLSFTITNGGGLAAQSLAAAAPAGGAGFSFPGGAFPGGGTCAAELAPGASCTVVVRFVPVGFGDRADTVVVSYGDGTASQSISVSVTGRGATEPSLSVTPITGLDFGFVYAGNTRTLEFRLTNGGDFPATALAGSIPEPELTFPGGFPGGGTCGAELAGGASCTVRIELAPPASGDYVGSPSVTYNDSTGAPLNVGFALSGTGVSPGDLDRTFGQQGQFFYSFGGYDDEIFASVAQPDGKIILVGSTFNLTYDSFMIVRLDTAGNLDPTFFDPSGISIIPGEVVTSFGATDSAASSVALQTIGGVTRIIVGGYVDDGAEGTNFAVARYNLDGTLDTTFGVGGIQRTDFTGDDDFLDAIAVQSDGKIVAVGSAPVGGTVAFALARYTADGQLDAGASGFGEISAGLRTGKLTTLFELVPGTGFVDGEAYDVTLVPGTDEIVAVGEAAFPDSRFAVAKYTADGDPSAGFGTGGQTTLDLGYSFNSAEAVAVIPSGPGAGKILVAGAAFDGSTGLAFALARFAADGTLDAASGFGDGGGGTVLDPISGLGYAGSLTLVLQSDMKIVLGGVAIGAADPDYALVRYLADGSRDTGFGTGGAVITDFLGGIDFGFALTLVTDGGVEKLVLSGTTAFPGGSIQPTSARYWP